MTTDYTGLVEFIVKNIVEKPEAVEVDGNSRRHRSQTVEVRLDPTDVGRVIGKGGKNIEAIRAVVKAAAIKDHTRVNVEVITEDDLRDGGAYAEDSDADDPAEGVEDREAEEAPEAGEVMSEQTRPEAVAESTDASTASIAEHPVTAGGAAEE